MKRLTFLLFTSLLLSGCNSTDISYNPKPLDPDVTYSDVYLIMGQSNASGVSPYAFLEESEPDLFFKYLQGEEKVLITRDVDGTVDYNFVPVEFGQGCASDFFGPEIGIAEILSRKETTSYIIKASYGGSCLQTQYVNGNGKKLELYNRYINFIKVQLNVLKSENINPRVRGVFWMQGESDSWVNEPNKYQIAEQYFLDYLRHDLNDYIYEYFNFVDAYISTVSKIWLEPTFINEAKQYVCDHNDHSYCIKTNGEDENALSLSLKSVTGEDPNDDAHYDSNSMLQLGLEAGRYLSK